MTHTQLPHRLTARDASWNLMESTDAPMHGGLILHYAGEMTRAELIEILSERLGRVPRLRQKLVSAPFGIAMPAWENDPAFDIANHIHELTLPAPGDDHVLGEVVGKLHSTLLDPKRPLWEMTLLHGRPKGTTVLFVKMHHSMVDAPALMRLVDLLHDDPQTGEIPLTPTSSDEPTSRTVALGPLQSAICDRMTELAHFGADMTLRLTPEALLEQSQRMMSAATASIDLFKPLPSMPWNGQLSSQRRVAWMRVSLPQLRHLRKQLDATINDLVMTVLAGGLGRYLRHHGRSTTGLELRDMVTVNVRKPEQLDTLGNHVTAVLAPLYVGIDDPIERLAAQRTAMNRIKQSGQAELFDSMSDLQALIPPFLFKFASLPRPQMPAMPGIPQPALVSVISSNIVGPTRRMHFGGHELVDWQGAGICMMNVGLFIIFQSYANIASISITVDPKLVPDEWFLIEQFAAELHELHTATQGLG